jgi:NADH-quinone oxidoreductase subunit L
VVTWPLIALAIPSVVAGAYYIEPMLFGDFFGDSIMVLEKHDVLAEIGEHYHGILSFIGHAFTAGPAIYLAAFGVLLSWFFYLKRPDIPEKIKNNFSWLYKLLDRKYYCDSFNDFFFAGGARGVGHLFWQLGDVKAIDGLMVNGTAKSIGWLSSVIRHVQTGRLYHYAFVMIFGLLLMLFWVLLR